MPATSKPLLSLTAGDLMTRDVVRLTEDIPLPDAASVLFQNRISGAPVVNAEGKCVGVLSTLDFLHLVLKQPDLARAGSTALPNTCSFQVKHRMPDGEEIILCLLPPDVCPLQREQMGPKGSTRIVCRDPHAVLTDWQVVEVEKLPTEPVGKWMTADPVMVTPAAPIGVLARLLLDAQIHRAIVVDGEQRPVGMVSSMDVLAAVASAARDHEAKVLKRSNHREDSRMRPQIIEKDMP